MGFWTIDGYRVILDTETDADSDLNEELLSQIRENGEARDMLNFYTGDSGTATSDPPDDTTGVLTDTGASYAVDEHNGRSLLITSGTAKGFIYTIDDTTATTLVCTSDNLYDDGLRSGDEYLVMYNLKNTLAHNHDGANSRVIQNPLGRTLVYSCPEEYIKSTSQTSVTTYVEQGIYIPSNPSDMYFVARMYTSVTGVAIYFYATITDSGSNTFSGSPVMSTTADAYTNVTGSVD